VDIEKLKGPEKNVVNVNCGNTKVGFYCNSKKIIKKKIFHIKFAYVTSHAATTSIKNHIYQYTPCETVICGSDGVTGDRVSHQKKQN
jgi:hypothetical protein